MNITIDILNPRCTSVSTLLISRSLCTLLHKTLCKNECSLKVYFHKLLSDPFLNRKLKFLRSGKWKCRYQSECCDLQRFNFRPHDADWAKLSLLSHGSGFSRCFIFVYLFMLDTGLIQLPDADHKFVGTHTKDFFPDKSELIIVIKLIKNQKLRRKIKQS